MRVLFIARNYPPHIGGAEKLNFDLAQNLKRFLSVKVLYNKYGKYSPLFLIYSLLEIMINGNKTDVVLLSDAYLSPIIPFIKKLARKPIIIKVNGLDITFPNRIYQFIIPKFVGMADKVICISKATKKECVKRRIPAEKCIIIPIGINPPASSYEDKEALRKRISKVLHVELSSRILLLSVGRLVKRKGFHWFIGNVIPKLLKSRDDFLYLIAGYGPYIENIKREIVRKNLGSYVVLLGKISDYMLDLLYEISDIFIMPNIPVEGDMEGFGIVVLEASSRGIPVIASNLEGIRDAVVDGKTGVLVEPLNADIFANEILNVVEIVKSNKIINRKIRQIVKNRYNWENIVKKYLRIISDLYEVRYNEGKTRPHK